MGKRVVVLIVAVLSLGGIVNAAIMDNLVAYYPLNETSGRTADDAQGGNDGTLRGNADWTTSGKLGGGVAVTRNSNDGTSYTVADGSAATQGWINADGLLDTQGGTVTPILNDTDSYTLSAWVQLNYTGVKSWGYAIWGSNTAATANGNVMRVGAFDDGVGYFSHGQGTAQGDGDFTDDAWHLATITFGTDGHADYYFDGALDAAADATTDREKLFSTATLFHFGMEMEGNVATDGWNGKLDELAIWNRELSSTEVSDLYNNGAGVVLPEPATMVLLALGGLAVIRRRRK